MNPDIRVKEASLILQRALDLENKNRYSESLICYQEGLRILLDYSKVAPDSDKDALREKIERFMSHAEKVKTKIQQIKVSGSFHEEISISDNETGYSYEQLFGRFFKDGVVESVKIEEPYIKLHHQFCNFVRFCELAVGNCKEELRRIVLYTKSCDSAEQKQFFENLRNHLGSDHNVVFEVVFSPTLHDRKITLSNGYVIKIGRGLDYFKAPPSKYCLGSYDMNLRPCHETKVDIYYLKTLME